MKKPIIFAAPVALILLAAGYFFVLPMVMGGDKHTAAEDEDEVVAEQHAKPSAAASAAKKKKKAAAEPGLIYPISDRVLNLAAPSGTLSYARIELALEFEKPAGPPPKAKAAGGGHGAPPAGKEAEVIDPLLEPVAARKAQIDDAIVRIIGQKTKDQIVTAEGKELLKQQIMDAVTEIVPAMDIIGVYIVRLVVQ